MAWPIFGPVMVVSFLKIVVIKLFSSDHKRGVITLLQQVEFKRYLPALVYLRIHFGKLDFGFSLFFITWCFC